MGTKVLEMDREELKEDLGYSYVPIKTEYGLSLISADIVAAGHDFKLIEKLSISSYEVGGFYYGTVTADT